MIQIEFTHFPGCEPLAVERGWPHLSMPYCQMRDDDVYDLANLELDPIIEMIDQAIDRNPQAFGVDWSNGDYETANDTAIELATNVAALAEAVIEDKDCSPAEGGSWSERYRDLMLADGVIIRIAYFASAIR